MISHTENTERNITRIKLIKVAFFLTDLRMWEIKIEDSICLTRSSLNCFLHLRYNVLKRSINCYLSLTAKTMSIKLPSCLPASRTLQ